MLSVCEVESQNIDSENFLGNFLKANYTDFV
jgi:hypothetical protein